MHTANQMTYLRLTAYVAATPPTAPQDDSTLWETPLYAVPSISLRGNTLLMQVVGNSMDDGTPQCIPHGSLVMVDTQDMEFHQMRRGYVYVFVAPDGATVAKKYDLHRGKYALISLNPDVPPIVDFRRAGYEPVGLLYAVRESEAVIRFIRGN